MDRHRLGWLHPLDRTRRQRVEPNVRAAGWSRCRLWVARGVVQGVSAERVHPRVHQSLCVNGLYTVEANDPYEMTCNGHGHSKRALEVLAQFVAASLPTPKQGFETTYLY